MTFFFLFIFYIVRPLSTGRKPPLQGNSFKSAMKQVSRDVEALETDPEDVTDEMMEAAYFRYCSGENRKWEILENLYFNVLCCI